jgi:hypothetical protein
MNGLHEQRGVALVRRHGVQHPLAVGRDGRAGDSLELRVVVQRDRLRRGGLGAQHEGRDGDGDDDEGDEESMGAAGERHG